MPRVICFEREIKMSIIIIKSIPEAFASTCLPAWYVGHGKGKAAGKEG